MITQKVNNNTYNKVIDNVYSKDYSYKQFLAALIINSDSTTQETKNQLKLKYGEHLDFTSI